MRDTQVLKDAVRILERAYDLVDADETFVSRFDPISDTKQILSRAIRHLNSEVYE